ncbi:ferredoxin [Streptomyces sp. NPDC048254]|uniref:ferredoxin n=1 Tax=Streptomyces sp. NPDC048254 TaxID=3365525 RepID=UPI00371AAD27
MIVTVEEDKCVAAGQCVVAAPEVFDQRDDDGVVILLQEQPPADEFERVRTAATICPAAAIRLSESLRT